MVKEKERKMSSPLAGIEYDEEREREREDTPDRNRRAFFLTIVLCPGWTSTITERPERHPCATVTASLSLFRYKRLACLHSSLFPIRPTAATADKAEVAKGFDIRAGTWSW